MLRLLILALLLLPGQQEEADKAAAELLKKVENQVMKAKSAHIEFEAGPAAAGKAVMLKGEVKIGEGGAFYVKATVDQGRGLVEEMLLRSDGRSVVGTGSRATSDFTKWKPEAVQRCLRRVATGMNFMGLYLPFGKDFDPESMFEQLAPKDVKSEGKEKVGDVEATVVSFNLEIKDTPKGMKVKLWIDPAKLTILKRSMTAGAEAIDETTPRFELNASFAADFFEFQTAALLLEARTLQVRRSIELFARYTGRLPKTLEDLAKRPADLEASTFWPECGFWPGGTLPKEIVYSVDGTTYGLASGGTVVRSPLLGLSPVGAPTDRLRKFYTARVQIQLLRAAMEAYHKAASMMPRGVEDLVRKPELVRFWPEGGWIAGDKFLSDPWGQPYQVKMTSATVSVRSAKLKEMGLKSADLTAEERKGLEEAATPTLGAADQVEVAACIRQLSAENLEDREKATQGILAKGAGALRAVRARLEAEKDAEVSARLKSICERLTNAKPSWEEELKPLRAIYAIAGGNSPMNSANERNAAVTLKTFTTAQADFRSNDRDGNRQCDFWVRDVAGLYGLEPATAEGTETGPGKDAARINKLIDPSAAKADATEGRWTYPTLGIDKPQPKAGYLFAAIKHFEEAGGKLKRYDKGNGRNPDQFAFVAFPAEYLVNGRMTFIVNEDNCIWQKDLEGEDLERFPANPAAEGWLKMD